MKTEKRPFHYSWVEPDRVDWDGGIAGGGGGYSVGTGPREKSYE